MYEGIGRDIGWQHWAAAEGILDISQDWVGWEQLLFGYLGLDMRSTKRLNTINCSVRCRNQLSDSQFTFCKNFVIGSDSDPT